MPEIHREDPISHALTNLGDASRSTTNTQAQLACMLFLLSNTLMKAFQVLGKARNASGIAAIQSGFSSADETKTAGNFVALGGFALGAAGVAQGVGSFKQAQGIAKAVENRENMMIKAANDTEGVSDILAKKNSDLTIQVEAVDEPITAPSVENEVFLDAEEEIFYDAEETLSAKQSNSDEHVEDTNVEEDEGKMSVEELEKCKGFIQDNYEAEVKNVEAKADKIKGLAAPGQGVQIITTQGLSEFNRSKSKKDEILQQVQQGNQSQEEETARDVKAKADELTKFDPFASNSGSLRG